MTQLPFFNYAHRTPSFPSIFITLILLFVMILPGPLRAQMFSMGDDNERRSGIPGTAIYAGWEMMDFSYEGDDATPGAGVYDFNGDILRFRLETFGATLYMGTGVGLEDRGYFDAGIRYGYGLRLYRSEALSLQLPIVLHSSYTSVTNDEVVLADPRSFQHGTLELGTGLALNARPATDFRFTLRTIPSYGFAFATRQQDAGGSIAAVKGESRFYFDYLFGNAGLALGYDFNGRRFNNEGEFLDYTASAHSFIIGITF